MPDVIFNLWGATITKRAASGLNANSSATVNHDFATTQDIGGDWIVRIVLGPSTGGQVSHYRSVDGGTTPTTTPDEEYEITGDVTLPITVRDLADSRVTVLNTDVTNAMTTVEILFRPYVREIATV